MKQILTSCLALLQSIQMSQADPKHTIFAVGAHHQNAPAEHAIEMIQDMTCSMLILSVYSLDG